MAKDNKNEIGIAGEMLVASKLSQKGYIVAPTLKNTKGIDILVSNGKAAKMIQVKTTETGKPVWVCQKPKDINSNIVYIFVGINNDAPLFFHIASSKDVLETIEEKEENDRKKYKEKYGKNPPQTDRVVPKFIDDGEKPKFKDKWENIGLPLANTNR